MITKQLREEKMAILAPAGDPPVVAKAGVGTTTAQRGSRNSDILGVGNEMVFNYGMRFRDGGNSTGDINLDHARGHRSPHMSSLGDAAGKIKSTSSRTSSVNLGISHTHESRRGSTTFNPGTYSSGAIDEKTDQGAAPITSQRPHIKSNNSASSLRSRSDLRRNDVNAMNTTTGPIIPSDSAYDPDDTRITENVGTPVAGLNSAVIPPSVSRPHSNHSLPIGDNRTRTLNGRETPQVYRVDYIAPSFQEVPNVMVHHAPQKLVPSTGTAHEHSSLVRQCTYLTEIHNPHLDRASAGTVDWQKKRAIEVSVDVFRVEIPLTLKSNQDLVAAVDGLVSLDDAIAGSLIGDCETLLDNHTYTAEGSLKTPDAHKLSMMRVSASITLPSSVAELICIGGSTALETATR